MNKGQFLFITDFDGTLTAQDFYLQILYRFEHEKVFLKRKKAGVELLSEVLESANLTEKEFEDEIKHIPLDFSFIDFYNFVKEKGGDVLILSAGCKYYIEKRLEFEGLKNIKIIANDGCFKDGGFKFLKNENKDFYSEKFGVDKVKVVEHYKKKYKKIYYAGDSYIDFKAAELADIKFAKKNLVEIFKMLKLKFFEFYNFDEIKNVLLNIVKI